MFHSLFPFNHTGPPCIFPHWCPYWCFPSTWNSPPLHLYRVKLSLGSFKYLFIWKSVRINLTSLFSVFPLLRLQGSLPKSHAFIVIGVFSFMTGTYLMDVYLSVRFFLSVFFSYYTVSTLGKSHICYHIQLVLNCLLTAWINVSEMITYSAL